MKNDLNNAKISLWASGGTGRPACRQAGAQVRNNMYYVYIIQSSLDNGFIYKGITNNIERRLNQHNLGKVASTRSYCPLNLIHVEIVGSRVEARKFEKFFKSGYGREVIKEIIESL